MPRLFADRIGHLADAAASFLADAADRAAQRWQEVDHGIWEVRGEPRHFLYSKLMCWVALDRAAGLASELRAEDRAAGWRREAERVREAILDQGWSDRASAFTQAFGYEELDASALMVPIVGFLPADPRRGGRQPHR